MLTNSKQSVSTPQTTRLLGQLLATSVIPEISVSGDKQQAVSGNTSDHPTIGAAARNQCISRDLCQCLQTASSQRQHLRPPDYWGSCSQPVYFPRSLSVVTNSKQSVTTPQTTRLLRQLLATSVFPEISVSGDKQQAVSDNTSDHPTIGAAARNQCISRDLCQW